MTRGSDIYAIAAMLYRMLTGKPCLELDARETPRATADNLHRIRNQAAKPPSHPQARALLARLAAQNLPVLLPEIVLADITAGISRGTG